MDLLKSDLTNSRHPHHHVTVKYLEYLIRRSFIICRIPPIKYSKLLNKICSVFSKRIGFPLVSNIYEQFAFIIKAIAIHQQDLQKYHLLSLFI